MVELLEKRESIDGWLDQGSVYIRGVPRVRHEANTNAFDRHVPTGMLWRSKLALVWWVRARSAAPFSKTAGQLLGRNLKNGSFRGGRCGLAAVVI